MTANEIVDCLGPYRNKAERERAKNAITVALSHYPEFQPDKSTYPAQWSFDPDLVETPVGRGHRTLQLT